MGPQALSSDQEPFVHTCLCILVQKLFCFPCNGEPNSATTVCCPSSALLAEFAFDFVVNVDQFQRIVVPGVLESILTAGDGFPEAFTRKSSCFISRP